MIIQIIWLYRLCCRCNVLSIFISEYCWMLEIIFILLWAVYFSKLLLDFDVKTIKINTSSQIMIAKLSSLKYTNNEQNLHVKRGKNKKRLNITFLFLFQRKWKGALLWNLSLSAFVGCFYHVTQITLKINQLLYTWY